MAAAAPPRKRNRNRRRLWLIIGGVILALVAALVALSFFAPRGPAPGALPEGWITVEASRGAIDASVSATGNVEAAAEADLRFETTGTIRELLVAPGDSVEPGAPLARVDASGLVLGVEQAQADLRQAQADLETLQSGATAQELAEARARVEQARSQYSQTQSSVTSADIAAARADLDSARARLARLEAGPANADLASAEERVQAAQSALDQSRSSLAAEKERARLEVESTANALRNAQDEFSRIYWENRELDSLPGDLPQARIDQEAAADRAVRDAEAALENARIAYEQARQNEITTLATREAELQSAVANRNKVTAGAEREDVASARAEVARAEARIAQLTGANRSSDLAAQAANIEIAQAALDNLLADPSASNLVSREAAVTRAEVALRTAERNLEMATLKAPFAGTIGAVNMQIGESSGADATIAMVDLSSFHVDVPVDELDIAAVQAGQRVRISLDALPDAEVGGVVTRIAPQATRSDQGTTTYEVTVTIDQNSAGVRPGMTAVVEIITEEKPDVVLVPRRAVRTEGGQSFVFVPNPDLVPQPAIPGQEAPPPGDRRPVEIGLSNAEFVEILSGLQAGEQVLVQDVVSTFNPAGFGPTRAGFGPTRAGHTQQSI